MIIEFQGDTSVEIAHLGTREVINRQIRVDICRAAIDAFIDIGRRLFEVIAIACDHVARVLLDYSTKLRMEMNLVALAFLAMPGIAMNESDSAYISGIEDGYALGWMSAAGQQEPAYELAYNQGVAILNGWMDAVGYEGPRWENLSVTRNSYVLPVGLR